MARASQERLHLHQCHLSTPGSAWAAPVAAGDLTAELAEAAPVSTKVDVRIVRGRLVLRLLQETASTQDEIHIPLLFAEVRRIGSCGIVVSECPTKPRPPLARPAGAGACRRHLRTIAEAARHSWLLLAEGGEEAQRALETLSAEGAVRGDFEESYSFEAQLGSGASAEVLRATPVRGGFAVAVKRLTAREDDGDSTAELRREVRAMVALRGHGNIVALHGLFAMVAHGERTLGLVMELCSKTLLDAIGAGVYPESGARPLMQGILAGLAHMHSLDLVHRDVKPANVMLRCDGTAALADFGYTCSVHDRAETSRPCGSPGFIAPEIIRKEGCRFESDVWSAGATMHMMLSGSPPFWGSDVASTLRRCVRGHLRLDSPAFLSVSCECKSVLAAMLCREADSRPDATCASRSRWFLGVEESDAKEEDEEEEEQEEEGEEPQERVAVRWETSSSMTRRWQRGDSVASAGSMASHARDAAHERGLLLPTKAGVDHCVRPGGLFAPATISTVASQGEERLTPSYAAERPPDSPEESTMSSRRWRCPGRRWIFQRPSPGAST